MKQSNFLSLNWRDLLRSALTAILATLLYWAQTELVPSLNLSPEIKVLIAGGIASVIRRFFTKPDSIEKFADDIVGDRPLKDGGR